MRRYERTTGRGRGERRRVVVIDPGLIEPDGHHYEFARMLRAQLRPRFDVAVYAHAAVHPYLVAKLRARPHFRAGIYPQAGAASACAEYARMANALLAGLQRIDSAAFDRSTIAVMHTATLFVLGALADWYAGLPAGRRPQLFVQFQHPIEFMVEPAFVPQAIAAAADACDRLAGAGSVRFATNSRPLAERLSRQLGQAVALMPIPVSWPAAGVLGGVAQARPLTFGFFGGLRAEKGSRVLAQAIEAFVASGRTARFIVHAPPGPSDPGAVAIIERLPHVELIRTSFVRKADYFARMRDADWLLLPYDPAAYAERTSGVLLEALGLGLPVITTAATWMAGELQARDASGLLMDDYSAASLYACLVDASAQAQAPKRHAAAMRPDSALMAEQSAENFCALMLRAFDEPPAAAAPAAR